MRRLPLAALVIAFAVLSISAYGFFEARRLIEGPIITIEYPINGSATSSTGVIISGTAQNISFLTINDLPSYTDKSGHFSELLSIPPGFTVLTVQAVDRFGRRAAKSVSIQVLNYCPITNA
ncbi:MAG TPA: hypothetical protein VMR46_01975 [Candidatus Paceibacterota bacterium]|nr:hypothetical protein [Candidatus Paceibacterota bacterium]